MKKTSTCSKCNGINLWKPMGPPYSDIDKVNIGWNATLSLIKLACLDCGYIEFYLDLNQLDNKKMRRIEENWIQVNGDSKG